VQASEDYILQLLEKAKLITRAQIESVQSAHSTGSVIDALVKAEVVSDADVSRALAAEAHMEWIDIAATAIPSEVIQLVSAADAKQLQIIPVGLGEVGLIVAVGDPLDLDAIDKLRFVLKQEIELVCASPAKLREAVNRYYELGDSESTMSADLGNGTDAPIVQMVSNLLAEAHRMGASDIHLEPLDHKFQVRFRIDGVLREMPAAPKRMQSAIISRLKIMTGSMSIAEKRLPQDGRIQVKVGNKPIDLRVSTIPTNHGESVVMRVLDKSSLMLGLPELGFLDDDQATFERLLRSPDGILLVTGPTGSGKTSTLYACLNFMNKPDRKIITVEEPVEYQMAGINQVQVNPETGMTFPVALRSILRQAPNIIMIGEIRDRETAMIATNASLTGHLVFSTLHTNDAPSAVARLVDIGVQPFLVASSLRAVLAQRLVRRLCPSCKQPTELGDTALRTLNIDTALLTNAQVMKPVGCDQCRHTGYKGRLGIFEILIIDDDTRHLINQRASTTSLRRNSRTLGMRTLREDGVRKIMAGFTSIEEIVSTTIGDAA
jgi:type IV pilus assembly protein PilB